MKSLCAAAAAALVCALPLAGPAQAAEFGDFTLPAIEGGTIALGEHAGKAVLVVNTASRCGFTYQYEQLQSLWDTYRDRPFVLIGVPSNDFGGQEPGTNEEIKTFCEVNFNIDFPMSEKVHVKGSRADPLFAWFVDELGAQAQPAWNFNKYLIAPDGSVQAHWTSRTEPMSEEIRNAVEKAIEASPLS